MSQRRPLREKIILALTGCLVLIYVFVEYIGEPLYREQKRQEQKIENKILFIAKYHEILNQKSYYREKEQANQRLSAELGKLFLSASSQTDAGLLAKLFPPPPQPSLAAAELQKLLEGKARRTRVNLTQVRTEKTKYLEGLLTVPVRITVKSTLDKFSRFIRLIENDEKFLVIEELVVRRINKKEPEQLEARLLVSGFIQKRIPGKLRIT